MTTREDPVEVTRPVEPDHGLRRGPPEGPPSPPSEGVPLRRLGRLARRRRVLGAPVLEPAQENGPRGPDTEDNGEGRNTYVPGRPA